jgi:hypothetical protein
MSDPKQPAFPVTAGNQVYTTGMTLRDWFAGQVLEAKSYQGWPVDRIAKYAYEIADAMLKEREGNE